MSYSQEIYDAVRSKISNGDVGSAVAQAAREAFDISWKIEGISQEFIIAAQEQQRPSVLFRPQIMQDGNSFIALLGENLAVGVVGCGDTPAEAMLDFDKAFYRKARIAP